MIAAVFGSALRRYGVWERAWKRLGDIPVEGKSQAQTSKVRQGMHGWTSRVRMPALCSLINASLCAYIQQHSHFHLSWLHENLISMIELLRSIKCISVLHLWSFICFSLWMPGLKLWPRLHSTSISAVWGEGKTHLSLLIGPTSSLPLVVSLLQLCEHDLSFGIGLSRRSERRSSSSFCLTELQQSKQSGKVENRRLVYFYSKSQNTDLQSLFLYSQANIMSWLSGRSTGNGA